MLGGRRGDEPPRRYRDTEFNDHFDFIPRTPPLSRGVRGDAQLTPASVPGRRMAARAQPLPNATSSRSLAPQAVRLNTLATAIDRRIVNVPEIRDTSVRLRRRAASPVSDPWRTAANRAAKQYARGQAIHAKEISADRRFNNFSTYPKNVNGTYARIVPTLRGKLRFVSPQFVFPCVQRVTRRECLFAFKKAGRAGAHLRRPRRKPHYNIGC